MAPLRILVADGSKLTALIAGRPTVRGAGVQGRMMANRAIMAPRRAVGVRGNICKMGTGWRVATGNRSTFRNIAAPDEKGAGDAVMPATEMGFTCPAGKNLGVVRLTSPGSSGTAGTEQFRTMSPGCS